MTHPRAARRSYHGAVERIANDDSTFTDRPEAQLENVALELGSRTSRSWIGRGGGFAAMGWGARRHCAIPRDFSRARGSPRAACVLLYLAERQVHDASSDMRFGSYRSNRSRM